MSAKRKIMLVEDEVDIREILEFNLQNEGYEICPLASGEEALERIDDSFSLLILDVMLDGISGFKVADILRKAGNQVPIIFLTAKDTENDVLTGFSLGGDDYVRKPFHIKELIARVNSVINRSVATASAQEPAMPHEKLSELPIIERGPLKIDLNAMTVHRGDELIDVTKTEYDILVMLATNEGRTFPRSEILNTVWQDNGVVLERTVDVHIARLRKKLGDLSHLIVNRVGFGYAFKLSEGEVE